MQDDFNLRKRKEIMHDYKLADRISALEDEVLVSILTLLSLKDAAAASILSKRWRSLWRHVLASTMTLNFDAGKTLCSLIDLSQEEREQKICRYVEWVNSVVEQPTQPNIKKFRVAFDLNNRFSSSINEWIQFAFGKNVRILELDLSEYGVYNRTKSCYRFSHSLLDIERGPACTTLPCDISTLNPRVYLGFKSLKVLTFKFVDVAQDVLEYFLSNCPLLEQLSVFHSPSLVNLRVVCPSISLKSLEIQGCKNIRSIEICDAKLVSFSYGGNEISVLVRNVPQLVEVSISENCICNNFIEVAFIQLSRCLSQLEILKLCGRVAYKTDHVFPILASLKHLEFTFLEDDSCSLLELTSILRASPSLHRLVLHVKMDYTTSKRRKINYKAPKCSHNTLKVVELVGYDGHKSDFELVKFLAKTARKLEKIVIKGHEGENTWRKMARDFAREKLKEKLPSTVDFVYTP